MNDKDNKAQVVKQRGVITFYNPQKGFGYIKPEDKREEIFFHYTGVDDLKIADPMQNERVSFEEAQGKDRLEARHIVRQWDYGILEKLKNKNQFVHFSEAPVKQMFFYMLQILKTTKRLLLRGII